MRLLSLALLLALTAPSASVDVYPRSGIEPLTVRVRTTIERDSANRFACLYYASEDSDEATSCWTLDGDRAARTETRYYRLPAGEYVFGLEVTRGSAPEKITASRERVVVLGH